MAWPCEFGVNRPSTSILRTDCGDNSGMEIFSIVFMLGLVAMVLNGNAQRKRLGQLAGKLRPYQIERNMESLIEGYLRAVGEGDPVRQQQVWGALAATEQSLSQQLSRLVEDLRQDKETSWRMSGVPFQALLADKLPPSSSFDLAALMQMHAQGVAACARHPEEETPAERKQRAFTMTAELLLMQHSCHWYCRSLSMASARLQARHSTSYQQVVSAVSSATRQTYTKITSLPF